MSWKKTGRLYENHGTSHLRLCKKNPVWKWPFCASLGLAFFGLSRAMNKHTLLKIEKEKRKTWRLGGWVLSKASASVEVTSEGGPDTRLYKGMRLTEGTVSKAVDLRSDSQGRGRVAVGAAVLRLHMQADRKWGRSHSSPLYSSVREEAIFILHHYPFYFYFNFLPVRYESPRCFGTNLSAFDLLSEASFSSSRGTCSLPAIYYLE